jgi:uncharacterized membrane-anchored protein
MLSEPNMDEAQDLALTKVPEVTLLFWIVKILATTLGETGGDAVTMSMGLGYAAGTAIFAVLFLVFVAMQIRADQFHPWLYWATIIATTTVGTTLADLSTRDIGIGYLGGSALLAALLLASLAIWHISMGSVSIRTIISAKAEMFYWVTIMFSQALGTALGDWVADAADAHPAGLGLGYEGAAIIFGGLLVLSYLLYRMTRVSHVALFWAAFMLTRPLGAVLGDLLDKPAALGGWAVSRYGASAVLVAAIAICIALFKQRPTTQGH